MSATASSSSDLVRSTRQQLDELDALLERMLELPVDAEGASAPTVPSSRPSRPEPERPSEPESRPAPEPRVDSSARSPGEAEAVLDWLRSNYQTGDQSPPPPPAAEKPDASGEEEAWVPLRSTWQPSDQTWGPLAKSWREANSQDDAEQALPPGVSPTLPVRSAPSEPAREMPEPAREMPQPAPEMSEPQQEAQTPSVATNVVAPEQPSASEEEEQIHATLADALARIQTSEVEDPLVLDESQTGTSFLWTPMLLVNNAFDSATSFLGPLGRWIRSPLGREILAWVGGLALVAAGGLLAIDRFGWTW